MTGPGETSAASELLAAVRAARAATTETRAAYVGSFVVLRRAVAAAKAEGVHPADLAAALEEPAPELGCGCAEYASDWCPVHDVGEVGR